jgi:hypothetical protein
MPQHEQTVKETMSTAQRKTKLTKNLATAMKWYRDEIYNPERTRILASYGFSMSRAVGSNSFEAFAAMLLNLRKAGHTGEDLPGWEIKSARGDARLSKDGVEGAGCKKGTRFLYEYYPLSGLKKLENECVLQHMYIVYKDLYASVDVWVLPGQDLAPMFKTWKTDMTKIFRRGRHGRRDIQKSLLYSYVKAHGQQVMQIRNGTLTFCDTMLGAAIGRAVDDTGGLIVDEANQRKWTCLCGKYVTRNYRGVICDKCGVEVTQVKARNKVRA